MKKAVLFDMDGTLIDASRDILVYLNATLTKYGYAEITLPEARRFVGNGARKLVERAIKGKPCDETTLLKMVADYNNGYNFCDGSRTLVYDGMAELAARLKKEGYKIAVVSNKPQDGATEVVKRFFPTVGFDFVCGQREGMKTKPDRECVDFTLKELGVTTEEAIFVGDSDTDFMTMKNACVDGICVLWGYRSKEELTAIGATTFASTACELYEKIKAF